MSPSCAVGEPTTCTMLRGIYNRTRKDEILPDMAILWDTYFAMSLMDQAIIDGLVSAMVERVKQRGVRMFGPMQAFELLGKIALSQACDECRAPYRLWMYWLRGSPKGY